MVPEFHLKSTQCTASSISLIRKCSSSVGLLHHFLNFGAVTDFLVLWCSAEQLTMGHFVLQSYPFLTTVIDGVLLPKAPEEILSEKNFSTVPYIVGINKQEFGWFIPTVRKEWSHRLHPRTHHHLPPGLLPFLNLSLNPRKLFPWSQVNISMETFSKSNCTLGSALLIALLCFFFLS